MSDAGDDVLRDLLLARGLNEVAVDALIKVAARIQWLQELNEDDRFLHLQGEEAVSFAVNTMDDLLSSRSRAYAPKRPPRPLPSMAEMNAIFRDAFRGAAGEFVTHPFADWNPPEALPQQSPYVSIGGMTQGAGTHFAAPAESHDEPR